MNVFAGASVNKKNNIFLKIILGLVFLFALIGGLNLFQNQIKNYLYLASLPIEKSFWKAGDLTSKFLSSLFGARKIAVENENLKIENQSLLIKIVNLQTEKKQNADAVSMVNSAQDFKYVMAGVIGFDSADDIVSINKGYDDGIKEGMPVVSAQKVVFGKILKTYKNFSEVLLISNKNNVLNVKINDVLGITRGNGNLGVYLDLIPIDSNINKDDVIVTSALEGVFPKDLLVGKVEDTNKNDLKPFQIIKIQPFFDLKSTENLFVITDYKQ